MVSTALRAVVLLDDHADLSLLVAHIGFHAPAGPVNVVFAHVTVRQRSATWSEHAALVSAAVVILIVLVAILPVPMRFFVTDPTEVVEAGITMSSPSPAATIERFVPLVKDIDDEVSPPFLLLPLALQRSAAQIKPIDYKAMKSSPPSPPPFLLLAVHERSVPLGKHVNDKGNISSMSTTRLTSQIKHVGDKGSM
ncbi:hypothetical protein EDD15DRAFT_2193504 [Pisolithus albus]|nr:hypothetical protein EDD15DRAFT_2193504 [Pisolithus albus]